MLLSSIARLNPYVDMKKIVIGLMDRLSSYAVRDADTTDDPAKRKESEEGAVASLLENLKLSAAKQAEEAKADGTQENGTETKELTETAEEPSKTSEPSSGANGTKLTTDIKLYEIFYEQVVNLIKTRGLPIQDTIALLVSLVNLAL
jgi:vacuolar protein sorting-associated protein 35